MRRESNVRKQRVKSLFKLPRYLLSKIPVVSQFEIDARDERANGQPTEVWGFEIRRSSSGRFSNSCRSVGLAISGAFADRYERDVEVQQSLFCVAPSQISWVIPSTRTACAPSPKHRNHRY